MLLRSDGYSTARTRFDDDAIQDASICPGSASVGAGSSSLSITYAETTFSPPVTSGTRCSVHATKSVTASACLICTRTLVSEAGLIVPHTWDFSTSESFTMGIFSTVGLFHYTVNNVYMNTIISY